MTLNVFLLVGSEGPGPVERWVQGGRLAAARDALQLAARLPGVERLVVAASAEFPVGLPVTWDFDPPEAVFHFGRRLAGLAERYPADEMVYLGAGSLPLLPFEALAEAVEQVRTAPHPAAVTNNLYSSDWLVFNCPAAVQARTERLERDNSLGWVLSREAEVTVRAQPPSAATRLDIDTPADLLLLSLHPGVGSELAAYLRAYPGDVSRWRAAGQALFTPASQVAFIGRMASGVWSHVEAHTQSWLRVFSEERGMAASGRQAAGLARSLIARHLWQVGPAAFFSSLADLAQAVFFDTRVALAHLGRWPSAADRYASDLGRPDLIQDDLLRELTAAALSAPMPVVLGGHGVVAGDLYGLVEIAQSGGLLPFPK